MLSSGEKLKSLLRDRVSMFSICIIFISIQLNQNIHISELFFTELMATIALYPPFTFFHAKHPTIFLSIICVCDVTALLSRARFSLRREKRSLSSSTACNTGPTRTSFMFETMDHFIIIGYELVDDLSAGIL